MAPSINRQRTLWERCSGPQQPSPANLQVGVTTIDTLLALAHSIHSNKGVFALLLGSGVSRASGVPTGWEVTLDLVRRLARLQGESDPADPEAWYTAKHGKAPDYSELLDGLARTPAERRSLLQTYFEPTPEEREDGRKLPSAAHRAIALLAVKGYIRVILTTNFDKLMEVALRDAGIEPSVVSNADAARGAVPLAHQRCVVIKLHGDYLDDRIKNTAGELETYEPAMDAYLDRVLDEFGLIVCGWSGEWDQALRAAIERCPSRRYSTYWTSNRALGPRAQVLADQRRAEVFQIQDADALFTALEDKVASLEELGTPHPLSTATAAASVKRYVAEHRHRVRLHDLILGETAEAMRRLAASMPLDGPGVEAPTPETFRTRVLKCDAATEVLRTLFFHGCRWAEKGHHNAFTEALALTLLPTRTTGSVYTIWLEMQAYPGSLALYSGGLGAVAAGNYGLLVDLLNAKVRHNDREKTAAIVFAAEGVFSDGHQLAQALHSHNRHLPVSDHMAEVLLASLQPTLPDADRRLSELEFLVALHLLHVENAVDGKARWFPTGRFLYRRGPDLTHEGSAMLTEARAEGANWAPLRSGMFDGSLQRFQSVATTFEASIASMRRNVF